MRKVSFERGVVKGTKGFCLRYKSCIPLFTIVILQAESLFSACFFYLQQKFGGKNEYCQKFKNVLPCAFSPLCPCRMRYVAGVKSRGGVHMKNLYLRTGPP